MRKLLNGEYFLIYILFSSYNQAIKLNPNYLNLWINKGSALIDLKRYEEAIEW